MASSRFPRAGKQTTPGTHSVPKPWAFDDPARYLPGEQGLDDEGEDDGEEYDDEEEEDDDDGQNSSLPPSKRRRIEQHAAVPEARVSEQEDTI
jgi:hypothetical protein